MPHATHNLILNITKLFRRFSFQAFTNSRRNKQIILRCNVHCPPAGGTIRSSRTGCNDRICQPGASKAGRRVFCGCRHDSCHRRRVYAAGGAGADGLYHSARILVRRLPFERSGNVSEPEQGHRAGLLPLRALQCGCGGEGQKGAQRNLPGCPCPAGALPPGDGNRHDRFRAGLLQNESFAAVLFLVKAGSTR